MFIRFSKKVYDPQTKNPNLGEHLSHPFDLQRRKLKPERGWGLLRKVQSAGEELREKGKGPDSGPRPQAQPSLWCKSPSAPRPYCTVSPAGPEAGDLSLKKQGNVSDDPRQDLR